MSSTLELLLGAAPADTPINHRTLQSDDGIRLLLLANATDDQFMLTSSPGHLPHSNGIDWRGQGRWHHTLAHPRLEGLRCSLLLVRDRVAGGRLHLVDVWKRHELQAPRRQELLDDHTRRHRLWLQLLATHG